MAISPLLAGLTIGGAKEKLRTIHSKRAAEHEKRMKELDQVQWKERADYEQSITIDTENREQKRKESEYEKAVSSRLELYTSPQYNKYFMKPDGTLDKKSMEAVARVRDPELRQLHLNGLSKDIDRKRNRDQALQYFNVIGLNPKSPAAQNYLNIVMDQGFAAANDMWMITQDENGNPTLVSKVQYEKNIDHGFNLETIAAKYKGQADLLQTRLSFEMQKLGIVQDNTMQQLLFQASSQMALQDAAALDTIDALRKRFELQEELAIRQGNNEYAQKIAIADFQFQLLEKRLRIEHNQALEQIKARGEQAKSLEQIKSGGASASPQLKRAYDIATERVDQLIRGELTLNKHYVWQPSEHGDGGVTPVLQPPYAGYVENFTNFAAKRIYNEGINAPSVDEMWEEYKAFYGDPDEFATRQQAASEVRKDIDTATQEDTTYETPPQAKGQLEDIINNAPEWQEFVNSNTEEEIYKRLKVFREQLSVEDKERFDDTGIMREYHPRRHLLERTSNWSDHLDTNNREAALKAQEKFGGEEGVRQELESAGVKHNMPTNEGLVNDPTKSIGENLAQKLQFWFRNKFLNKGN